MARSERTITPQDDLVAALAATPKKGTLILAKGVYNLYKCLVVDKTVYIRGETGSPRDVVISREGATAVLVSSGKPTFEALTLQAPKQKPDVKVLTERGERGYDLKIQLERDARETHDIIEYKSAVAIRDKGDATFINCIATSGEQSGFSVRGKKARIKLTKCQISNTGEGGIFFDDQGRGVIEETIIENSGLGCVDVEEFGYVEVRNSKLLGSEYASISLHNHGRAKFVDSEVCGGTTSCALIVQNSKLVAVNTTFYSHTSRDADGSPVFSADGIIVADSYLKLVKTRHYAVRVGIGAEPNVKIILRDVTMERLFASIYARQKIKLVLKGANSLCVPPYVNGAFLGKPSELEQAGIGDEPQDEDSPAEKEYSQEERDSAYVVKDAFLQMELGEPWPLVLHAAIPFSVGGILDGYYYPNSKYGGTIMVSKEVATPDFDSPNNREFQSFELAIATRDPFPYDDEGNVVQPNSLKKYQKLHKMLTDVARYVENTSHFNRYDSIGLGDNHEDPDLRGAAFVTDAICLSDLLAPGKNLLQLDKLSNEKRQEYEDMLQPEAFQKLAERKVPESAFDDRQFFGVIILIQIHPSELQALLRNELTREELVNELKAKGYWPFSDLESRPPLH